MKRIPHVALNPDPNSDPNLNLDLPKVTELGLPILQILRKSTRKFF